MPGLTATICCGEPDFVVIRRNGLCDSSPATDGQIESAAVDEDHPKHLRSVCNRVVERPDRVRTDEGGDFNGLRQVEMQVEVAPPVE